MKVLITGAGGFLGSHLVARFLAEGYTVTGIGRSPAPSSLANHPDLTWIIRDLSREGILAQEIEGVSTVFHLAGVTLRTNKDERVFFSSNEGTTIQLLRGCAGRVKMIVHASSQVVYGHANHLNVTENFPISGFDSAYGCSKVNAENWLRWYHHESGGVYIVLRLTGFIECGGLIDYLIDRAIENKPIELFSRGSICRDYLDIEDGINAFAAASLIHNEGFWVFNIGSGQAIKTKELAEIVCDEIGSASKIILIDKPAYRSNFVFDISRARAMLGFSPRPLEKTVRSYARSKAERVRNGR